MMSVRISDVDCTGVPAMSIMLPGRKPVLMIWKSFGNGPMFLPAEHEERQAAENQHAGQRYDEGRDAVIGDPIALGGADDAADDQAEHARQPRNSSATLTIMMAASAPTKATIEPTDRSIWPATMTSSMPSAMMTMNEFCRTRFVRLTGLEENAAGVELEEHHDRDERNEHAVFTDIATDVVGNRKRRCFPRRLEG